MTNKERVKLKLSSAARRYETRLKRELDPEVGMRSHQVANYAAEVGYSGFIKGAAWALRFIYKEMKR